MAGFLFNPLTSQFDLSGGSSTLSIGGPVAGSTARTILVVDGSNNLSSVGPLTNGQLLIGNTGNLPSVATLTGTSNQITVTTGSGSLTLSLPQNIHTAASPTFANLNLSPSGVLDTTTAGTLAIGTGNANIINIGNSGATVNIQGTTFYQNVTNLQVADKLITVNKGGSAGSGSNAGLEIEENGTITAYIDTTAARTGWELKAPASAGIVTITPGSSGFTLDQGSHNPVTIGTANGLSLSTQQLSLALASTSTTGALSSTDWNTFNNKQAAGNYITALTGDATASGPGSAALTLTTVNSNVGSFGSASSVASITVNAKGLVTAASSTSIQIAQSQVTNLTTDLAAKLTSVSVATANGFAGSSSGTSTPTLTLTTTITGLLKGNGTAISAATAGTDYVVPVSADIIPTTWSSLANNTSNQTITGFSFASTVKSFEALVAVRISATSSLYSTVKLIGVNKSSDWSSSDLTTVITGDVPSGLSFSINTSGQVLVSTGNYSGFTSGSIIFRAITLT